MEAVLARIDDRFIHGQVVVGWCRRLDPDRLLLCNDAIAADPWQCSVYASSVPPRYRVDILSREATAALWRDDRGTDRTLLLTGSPADMLWLVQAGVALAEVNVGGMHAAAGKAELLPGVYADAADRRALADLLAAGVVLFAQSVPGAPRHPLTRDLLQEATT